MRPAGWGGRPGWYRQVTITEKEGGIERKTNLTLPSYVWVGGETAKWPNAAEGETVAAFLCLFGMSDPPPKEILFSFEGVFCFLGGGIWGGKCGRSCTGGGASTRLVGMTPPPFCGGRHCRLGSAVCTQGGKAGKADKAGT